MEQPHSKKLLDQVRDALRLKHYSYRTEQAYVDWITRYILYHGKRHPQEMGAAEVQAFLTHLAVEKIAWSSIAPLCIEPFRVSAGEPLLVHLSFGLF